VSRGGARFLHKNRLALRLHTAYTQAMALFGSTKERQALLESLERHHAALGELQQKQALLETEFRNLQLEWLNAHEKLASISGRIAKRQAYERIEEPELPAEPGNHETDTEGLATVDSISAAILRRRNMGKPVA